MPRRAPLTAALTAVSCLAVAGCGFGAVTVDTYDPTPGAREPCRHLVDDLPEVVDDAVRRDVDTGPNALSDAVAAWGEPPIVLRCGVGMPPEYRPGAQLFEIDGIAWLPIDGEGGRLFATVSQVPVVEVGIPDDYAPESDVLADLADALSAHLDDRPLP